MQINSNLLAQNTPYGTEQIFTQMFQYLQFEVNLKRALFMNESNNLKKVYLINGYWFEQWKKITCYEAIKFFLNLFNIYEEK